MENSHEVTNEEFTRLFEEHRRRIEKLEDQVKELRDALAMK